MLLFLRKTRRPANRRGETRAFAWYTSVAWNHFLLTVTERSLDASIQPLYLARPGHPRGSRLQRTGPFVKFAFRPVLLVTVALLKHACELVAFARNHFQIIVCQFSPFLFDFAFDLHPVPFDLIPVHFTAPLKENRSERFQLEFAGQVNPTRGHHPIRTNPLGAVSATAVPLMP